MSAARRCFVDTSVLLSLTGKTDPARQSRSAEWLRHLWENGDGSLSWQVLQEFYANAVRKLGVAPEEARFLVSTFLEWHPVVCSPALLERARHWTDAANLSYWDALILGAAEIGRCGFLLSEDFQTGRRFGAIKVVNPFATAPPGR